MTADAAAYSLTPQVAQSSMEAAAQASRDTVAALQAQAATLQAVVDDAMQGGFDDLRVGAVVGKVW